MNFDAAVAAHANWKLKISLLREGRLQEPLDPRKIQRDDVCDLGKWIHGEGVRHAQRPEFQALRDAHSRFHIYTASLVEKLQSGNRIPESELSLGSDYGKLSAEVVQMLRALWRHVGG